MPCVGGYTAEQEAAIAEVKRQKKLTERRKREALLANLDSVTEKLCRTLKSLKKNVKHIYDVLPEDIREWHREHEADDAQRKRDQKKKKK